MELKITEAKQAQIPANRPESIQNITARLIRSVETRGRDISGCDRIPEGKNGVF